MLQWNAAFNTVNSADEYPTTAGKVGIAPMPAGPEGHKTHVHSLGIGMNTASQNKEQAGIFLGWLATEDAMKVYGAAGGTPPVPSVLQAMAADRPEFPLVGQYAADYGFVVNGGTAAQAVPTYEAIATAFSAVWSGQVSIEEGLAQAKAGMEAAMKAN